MSGLAATGLSRALYAEWTKLRTTPSTGLLPLAAAVMTTGLGAVICAVAAPGATSCAGGCDTVKLSLSGVYLGQLAAIVLAVLSITGEYHNGLIGTTLAAMPNRLAVFAAKAVAVTFAVVLAGIVGVAGSLLTGRVLLLGNGFTAERGYPPLSLADGPTLRATVGTVLYFGLIALFSFGVAVVLRHTAPALITLLGLFYLTPTLAQLVVDESWHTRIERYAPMTAGLSVQATRDLGSLPIAPWAGLGVLAVWACAAVVIGAALFTSRDA